MKESVFLPGGVHEVSSVGEANCGQKEKDAGGSELGRRFTYMGALTQWPFRVLGREGARIPALGEEGMCGR